MPITDDHRNKINNMNRAAQNVSLGTLVQNWEAGNFTGGSVAFGGSEGTAVFDEYGAMTFSGSATVWNDFLVPLTQTKIGANLKPDFSESEIAYLFPQNDADEKLYIVAQLPHSWKEGSTIYPHVHWKQTRSGSVVFKMDYKWDNIGEQTSGSFQTYVMDEFVTTYTSGSLYQINHGGGIDGSGKEISSLILTKLYREDNTYVGDAVTWEFDIHYEVDALGSDQQYIK